MNQPKCFVSADFTCANCHRELEERTAYSFARNWDEFDHYLAYCFDCVDMKLPEPEREIKPEPGKKTLNKTGRIYQLGTRVRKEFLKKLKKIARKERLKYVEVLERALDYYAERKRK